MPAKTNTQKRNIITDKLVIEKTGKTMEEWFLVIDKKGGLNLNYKDMYALVSSIKGLESLGEWNQNLLATSYCWNRGIRERGEKGGGFEISVSKTIEVPVSVLYTSLIDEKVRNKWLGKEKIIIRKATENKSVRITWSDNETSLSIDFYPKNEIKAQVVVQHQKISDSKKAEELKIYWSEKLEKLKSLLEK
ncbi:MAG: hypothetical protein Q8M29_17605 [Bacteroidota bacterium]|nr:hypothetical protein [Bacteroidota bacterium]